MHIIDPSFTYRTAEHIVDLMRQRDTTPRITFDTKANIVRVLNMFARTEPAAFADALAIYTPA